MPAACLPTRPRQPDERPQAGPRRPRQPLVEQVGRLVWCGLLQDDRQVLLQLIGAVESAILPAQRLQASLLAGLQPRGVFQQAEARPLERLGRLRTHAALLRPSDLVDRVRGEAFNVKPVEDHPRVRYPRPQRLRVRLFFVEDFFACS